MGDIERLDYSKPPLGYTVGCESGQQWYWARGPHDSEGSRGDIEVCHNATLAAAWTHYKEGHDPPGMRVIGRGGELYQWDVLLAQQPYVAGPEVSPEPWDDPVAHGAAKVVVRAAAWTWHDHRLALVERINAGEEYGHGIIWPRCLTWSDAQVAEVERWLSDGTAALPEVLRA